MCFHSEGSEEEGQPPTANPHAGSATHGQVVTKAPCKVAVGCSQDQPAREVGIAHKGSSPHGRRMCARSTTASPQGRQPSTPAYSTAPAKGAVYRVPARGYRQ
ncbi:hypothetical protein B296_00004804 [Ensete ventricosum]|uniref:Uncharacterized protein n=1 Tax=Ensete ventricosum TaxID=4639 RepID=A0A426Y8C0_ENSVE|nr:hypothetical protein B296_00004804 [Ensete ventricosum]